MRTITIRQLSVNLFKELEDLPITVTRYGKPYVVIVSTGPISQESQKSNPSSTVTPLERKAKELIEKKHVTNLYKERGDMNMEDYL